MRNKQILLSGRAVTTNAANVPADRYSFLHLSDAEPNLGTASANGWVLVYDTTTPGNRLWSEKLITGYNHANAAYASQNVTGTYANNAYAHANSSYLHANAAYASQNVTGTYANNAYAHANSSYLHANAAYQSQNVTGTYANNAYAHANAAYASQNVTGTYANNAYIRANNSLNANVGGTVTGNVTIIGNLSSNILTTTGSGGDITGANSIYATYIYAKNIDLQLLTNTAYAQANAAYTHANAAYTSQNVTGTYANNAYLHANAAYAQANSGYLHANAAYQSQNVTGTYANNAYLHANAAYQSQNVTGTYANNAYLHANSGFIHANAAYNQANSGYAHANASYTSQNVTGTYANNAYLHANSAYESQNITGTYANNAYLHANAAYQSQNVTGTYANNAYLHANSAYASQNVTGTYANNAYLHANAAFQAQNITGTYANSAYVRANNSLSANVGGTVTGNVTVQGDFSVLGNVFIIGNTFSISAGSIVANDSLLILGANNYYNDILDIGFAGHYNDGVNAHTGLIRDATDKEWYLFKGYTPELSPNNNIVITHPSFTVDTLNANLKSNNIIVRGTEIGYYANAAFLQANSAYAAQNVTGTYANNAYDQANSAASYANGAFVKANSAYAAQNVTGTYANNAYDQANSAASYANGAFVKANSAYAAQNVTGTYANNAYLHANGAYIHANSAYDTINSLSAIANTTNTTIIAVNDLANAAFIKANSAYAAQNVTGTYANNAYNQANSAASYANGAFVQANSAYAAQNITGSYANSAYVRANNSLDANNGGSITGTISVTGNVIADYVVANTGFASSAGLSRLQLSDIGIAAIQVAGQEFKFGASGIESSPGIYGGSFGGNKLSLSNETNLISNRYDVVKIQTGTTGTVVNEWVFANNSLTAPGNITATGFVAGGINVVPTLTIIGTYANAAFIQANAAFEAQNTTAVYANAAFLKTNSAYQHANSAYDSQNVTLTYANSGYQHANLAYLHANAAFEASNNAIDGYVRPHANASYNTANAAFAKANAAVFSITATTNETSVNTSTGNVQIGLANVNVNIGTFGGATAIPVINVDGKGRVLSISNTTISVPPGTYIFPNTNQLTTNANFGNVLIGLANVNSNIGTFGSEFAVPTITTDGYGRVTSISNTTISIPQGTYIVNSNLITSNSSSGNVVLGLAPSGVSAGVYGGAGKTPVLTVDTYGRVTVASNVDSSVDTLSTMIRNSFTATAAQTIFQTSTSFQQNYADVYVNGIKLSSDDYTQNGVLGQITLNAPILLDGDVVDIQTATTYIVNSNTNYQKADFVATAGQTTVTVSYVPGQVNVYLNGLRLKNGTDYTATSGTSIVFPIALELNDIVEVEKIGNAYIQLANSYFMTRNTISVTANGDTTFTVGGGYRVGAMDVYYNGIKLNTPNDVTATNGTTITLTSSSTEVGDFIEIVGIGSLYQVADAIPITGGTIYGSLNVVGSITGNTINVYSANVTSNLQVSYNVTANAINVATVYFNDGTQMITAASGSGTGITWKIISANTTANTTEGFLVNTTSANVYITLNASPSLGNTARIVDMAGNFAINNCIIKGNGNKVMGTTDDFIISSNNAGIGLVYSNATYGWRIIENP
jgi:hypothetical protein